MKVVLIFKLSQDVTHKEVIILLSKTQIGENLTSLRKAKGKTRDEVSKDLDISVSALGMYENGNRIPRDEIKEKLANYYQETIDHIFYTKQFFLTCNVT